jgi:hypothetical protein
MVPFLYTWPYDVISSVFTLLDNNGSKNKSYGFTELCRTRAFTYEGFCVVSGRLLVCTVFVRWSSFLPFCSHYENK